MTGQRARQLGVGGEVLCAEMSFWAGRDDAALQHAARARALDPESAGATLVTAYVESRQGRHAEAIASYLDYLARADKESITSPTLAWFYARAGRPGEAMDLVRRAAPGEISPTQMAWISAALGDRETAFTWMEKALAQRGEPHLDPNPALVRPARSDPRFQTFLDRMKLNG